MRITLLVGMQLPRTRFFIVTCDCYSSLLAAGGGGNTTSHLVIEYLHMIDKTIDHNTTTKSGRGIVLVLNFSVLSIIVSGHVSKIRKNKD